MEKLLKTLYLNNVVFDIVEQARLFDLIKICNLTFKTQCLPTVFEPIILIVKKVRLFHQTNTFFLSNKTGPLT